MKDIVNQIITGNSHYWQPMTTPSDAMVNPPKMIKFASDVYLDDVNDHRAIDAVGGLWNVTLGYSCARVKRAMAEQLETLPFYNMFRGVTHDLAEELAQRLSEFFAPEGMTRAFYTSGGSDCVETAIRLSRQYHLLRGEPERQAFVALSKGYHGTHTGAASLCGNPNFRNAYGRGLEQVFHIPAPYTYRNVFNEDDPARLADLCIQSFEKLIEDEGANTIAAFIMEPIMGAGGVIPPHPSFAPRMREICRQHGILFIADEVITAFGRTGEWTGSRLWGIEPDMMCTAKAITNGYFPFGALMLSGKVAEVFENDGTSRAMVCHGYTYSGHPVGAAAALASLDEMQALNVPLNAKARGDQMMRGLNRLKGRFEVIGDVRGGYGLMNAIELVTNRKTRDPMPADRMNRIFDAIYDAGVMVRISGPNIILSPALIITEDQVETILAGIAAGLEYGT